MHAQAFRAQRNHVSRTAAGGEQTPVPIAASAPSPRSAGLDAGSYHLGGVAVTTSRGETATISSATQLRPDVTRAGPKRAERTAHRGELPEALRVGLESMSGLNLANVRVHRDSAEPAQLNAKAYARGSEIHLAPGQEQHLPHEAWHIVQQRQGRVQSTGLVGNTAVNDDASLEREADVMGARAVQHGSAQLAGSKHHDRTASKALNGGLGAEPAAQLVRDNFTKRQRDRILGKNRRKNRGFYACENCGFRHTLAQYATYRGKRTGDGGFHVDHKDPASNGGRALARNAAVLCGTCNTSKGARNAAKRTGRKKYAGIHGGKVLKNYVRKRRG